jgi:hypothetical protein
MIKRDSYSNEADYESALETYNEIVGQNKNKIIAISGPSLVFDTLSAFCKRHGYKVSKFAVEAIKEKMKNDEKTF